MNPLMILDKLKDWGPVFFGVAFLAPLIAQSLEAGGASAPLGATPLQFGLVAGVALGLVAKLRGRWV
jgi:hypothetical protein